LNFVDLAGSERVDNIKEASKTPKRNLSALPSNNKRRNKR